MYHLSAARAPRPGKIAAAIRSLQATTGHINANQDPRAAADLGGTWYYNGYLSAALWDVPQASVLVFIARRRDWSTACARHNTGIPTTTTRRSRAPTTSALGRARITPSRFRAPGKGDCRWRLETAICRTSKLKCAPRPCQTCQLPSPAFRSGKDRMDRDVSPAQLSLSPRMGTMKYVLFGQARGGVRPGRGRPAPFQLIPREIAARRVPST